MTGEEDWRTPISEAEQYYAALKLLKLETALVRFRVSGLVLTSPELVETSRTASLAAQATKSPKPPTPSTGSSHTGRSRTGLT